VGAGTRFELSHEACCYAGRLGVVVVYPSLAANRTRLGGVVGKRAEAQMRVVVNEACDDDDDGVLGQMPLGVSPQSLEKTATLEGSTLDQSTKTLKKGMVVVRVQGG
jgi:hypothetical protein